MHLYSLVWLTGCLSSVSVHEAYREELADRDGDGFGSLAAGGTDCDDDDPRVNPDARDAPYDGLDADCAGDDDFDADSDGYSAIDYGGEDCEDLNPDVNPSAEEICGDGLDNDCDGGAGSCNYAGEHESSDALLSWTGQSHYERLGEYVETHGGDLAWAGLAIDGRIRVGWVDDVASSSEELETGHPRTLVDDVTDSSFSVMNAAMDLGDFDGDGAVDLAVAIGRQTSQGEPVPGSVFLFSAQSAGGFSEGVELVSIDAVDSYEVEGLNQSGESQELLVGACGEGVAWRLPDPLSSPALAGGLEVDLGGRRSGMGCLIADVGDMDGDGLHEVAFAKDTGSTTSEVWVLAGADLSDASEVVNGEDLAVTYTRGEPGELFGAALVGVGDLNGDGRAQVAVGAPCHDEPTCQGSVFLVQNESDWGLFLSDEEPTFGALLGGGEDASGDGRPDLLVGVPGEAAFLFSGPFHTGTQGTESAEARLVIPDLSALSMVSDLDGNGLAELFFGAPGPPGEDAEGQALLFVAPGM